MKITTFLNFSLISNYKKLADCRRNYHIILFKQNQDIEELANMSSKFKFDTILCLWKEESTLIWMLEDYSLSLNSWVFEKEIFFSFMLPKTPYGILNTLMEFFQQTSTKTIAPRNQFSINLNFFFFFIFRRFWRWNSYHFI